MAGEMYKDSSHFSKQKHKKDWRKKIHAGVLSHVVLQFLKGWKCEEHNVKIPLHHLYPNF